MSLLPTAPQMTRLFSNDVLGRVERMRLNPTRRQTNRTRGEHLQGKGGNSTEFHDFRDYVPGDDLRYIDWNVFARLNRPFLKLYKHEEEMHVVVLIDASKSMQFEGKLERAQQLAAACGLMGLMNQERVSIHVCQHQGQQPQLFPPATGRAAMRRMFEFIEQIPAGGDFPVDQAVEAVLRNHRGKGIVVILSDFLTFGELPRPFNLLYRVGLEVFAVQILSPIELNPELAGDLRFVDSETGQTLDVSSAGDLLGIYHEHRQALSDQLAELCRQRSGRFLSLSSQDDLEFVLFDTFRRRGWVR